MVTREDWGSLKNLRRKGPSLQFPESVDIEAVGASISALSLQIVAVHGPTGIGKSIAIPLAVAHWTYQLGDALPGPTMCAQPRRILARLQRAVHAFSDRSRDEITKVLYWAAAVVVLLMRGRIQGADSACQPNDISTVIVDEVYARSVHLLTMQASDKIQLSATGDHDLTASEYLSARDVYWKAQCTRFAEFF